MKKTSKKQATIERNAVIRVFILDKSAELKRQRIKAPVTKAIGMASTMFGLAKSHIQDIYYRYEQ